MDTEVKTIDEFIAKRPASERAALERLRKIIHKTCPDSQEKISYGIATFTHKGPLVGFGYAKNHLSFYCMNLGVAARFKDQLEGWKVSGGTIHFTPDRQLPHEVVEQIVRARMELNETKRNKRGGL